MNLDSLRTVLTEAAPTTTVWIDARRGEENGDHEVQLRWQDLADRLRELGAPPADLAALAQAATAPTGRPDPSSRVVAARDGRVVLDEVVVQTPPDGIGRVAFEALPDVEPLVAERQEAVGFVVAKVDRTGADVNVFSAVEARPEDVATVTGRTVHIHKVPSGGWSQLRHQHHTEEEWRQNARQVAELIHAKAQEYDDTLLVIGGDVRARTLVIEYLPKGYDVVEVEDDVRASGAKEDELHQAVHAAVAGRMREEADAVLDRFRAARAPMHDGTVTGTAAVDVDQTVAAFQQGQVAVLLLDPPALRSRRLVAGPGTYDLALPGAPQPWDGDGVEVPADLALLRSAVLTDAEVQLVRDARQDLPDGAAALLRWGNPEPNPAATRDGAALP